MAARLSGAARRKRCPFVPQVEVLEDRSLLSDLLNPLTQPKFVNALPVPGIMQPSQPGGSHYDVSVRQFQQDLGLVDPAHPERHLLTTVWGYNGTYPGATFEVRQGQPITVTWNNDLEDGSGKPLPHFLPVDTSIHWAAPAGWPASGVPIVTHLHGGHTESASDGLPEAWFTPGFRQKGPDWVKADYTYDNSQEATTLWYHDHALGLTRLNMYAGLVGFYLIRNNWEAGLNLPKGDYEIPLVIQDRMFTSDGQLFYPSTPEELGAPNPSVLPEFFGDIVLVNGKAWPVLNVEPRKYRFRLLNASDSRFYSLFLSSDQKFIQIGSDGGFLNAPVALSQLTLAPAERADVILDFSQLGGQTVILRNHAKAPFPAGDTADPRTVGQIMAFRVSKPLAGKDTSVVPRVLRPAAVTPPGPVTQTRHLLLFEGTDEYGRLRTQLGTAADGALLWHDPVTENPQLNGVEVWEFYNTTEDTHPIHVHLVQFQVLSRQKFTAAVDPETGALSNVRLIGNPQPPDANEAGLKDTLRMNPGEVTRIIAKFDREGMYVFHCHIVSHEDHQMMRPYYIGAMPPGGGRGGAIAPPARAAVRFLGDSAHLAVHHHGGGSLRAGFGIDLLPAGYGSGAILGESGDSLGRHLLIDHLASHGANAGSFAGMAGSMLEGGPIPLVDKPG